MYQNNFHLLSILQATVEPWAAFVIGVIAGWVYLAASFLLVRLKIDDAVDAIPVHFGGGMWGVLSVGLFTAPGRLDTAFGMTENVGKTSRIGHIFLFVNLSTKELLF